MRKVLPLDSETGRIRKDEWAKKHPNRVEWVKTKTSPLKKK